jgi:predicted amidohydrolase YtcJ
MLFYNGTILTMTGSRRAEALLLDGGRIVAAGDRADLERMAGPGCQRRDLQGAVVLPGFIDPHSHFVQYADGLRVAHLSDCTSFADIQAALTRQGANDGWIIGSGYDQDLLAEGRHPDKSVLDAVSATEPVVISHVSGHMGCVNSAALAAAGIGPDTPDPPGGKIGRDDQGRPNGYLEENAFIQLAAIIPRPDRAQMLRWLQKAQGAYFSYGITTAQEGLMRQNEFDLLDAAAGQDLLHLDVVGYVDIRHSADIVETHPERFQYQGHFRLGGYKLFLDGSPQGRTAWLTEPYLPRGDQGPDYRGYPIYSDEEVRNFVAKAEGEGRQLLTHCNGDAAIDQLLGAFSGPTTHRDVVIHSQLMRPDQLLRLKDLGLMPSYFVAHTWYWGDAHLKNLGPQRAGRISPLASTAALGIPFTLHQDAPVIQPNMLETVWCAVRRKTRGGEKLSHLEAVSPETALEAVTRWGAWQYFEEDRKGTLEPDKAADLVILDRDPTTVAEDEIRNIRILATIKDGRAVFQACR